MSLQTGIANHRKKRLPSFVEFMENEYVQNKMNNLCENVQLIVKEILEKCCFY